MNRDDLDTETIYAPRALAMTELPLIGMTLAGDEHWSARFWEKVGRGQFIRCDCESVRIVGEKLRLSYNSQRRPPPGFRESLARTISSWTQEVQDDVARLRVGIVGLGNVGAIVGEALARTGVQHLRLIDFDSVKTVNLDRLLHATERDARCGRSKVEVMRKALLLSATAAHPQIEACELSVVEEDGFRAALDCDALFSCVDRPWPRAVLNLVAYAHLIPVIDGGIRVTLKDGRLRSADWKAHVAAPGRRCLECLEQYNPAHVTLERQGDLDDPSYIEGLSPENPLRGNENVFAFGLAAGSLEVLQLLTMVVAPGGVSDIGSQHYNIKTGEILRDIKDCKATCLYSNALLGVGDQAPLSPLGVDSAARTEQEGRRRRRRSREAKIGRAAERLRSFVDRLELLGQGAPPP
jgi:molybdopterin/thiamine biosynthesis adenylyltransferase